MDKTKFLEKLEKKLNILDESEKKDIIAEYSSIIDEKVKNGATEKEAIDDFGSVNELAKEILKAYKVNTEYNKYSDTFESGKESFDETIKKSATWLSEKANNFFNDLKGEKGEVTVEKVFEIMIKVFIVLIILNVLRLPISLISSLGQGVFAESIFPFVLLKYLWIFVVEIAYIVIVVLFIFFIFKENFFGTKQESEKPTTKKKPTSKKTVAAKKENKIVAKPTNENNGIKLLIKLIIILCIVIPLAMFSFSLVMALSFGLYLIFKGVFFYGPVLLLIGILIFIFYVMNAVFAAIENHKVKGWPLLISFIIITTGIFLTIDWALSLKIHKGEPGILTEETIMIERKEFSRNRGFWDYELHVNPDVDEDKIMVIIKYNEKYADFVNVNEYGFSVIKINNFTKFNQLNREFIDNLKNNEIYIPYYEIEIHAQEETINQLRKKNF